MDVFLLWHVHEFSSGEEDAKLLGVYASRELAEQAQQRAATRPGFRDAPAGFCIDRYTVDQDHWTDGYVTVTYREVEPRWQADNAEPPGASADRPRE